MEKDDPHLPRWLPIFGCGTSIVLCLCYARFRHQLPEWWKSSGGGIPYVMFWIFLWAVVFPWKRCIVPICVGVTLVTCMLEVLQLWQPAILEAFRGTRLGAALIGREFAWPDFPPYFIGMAASYLVLTAAMAVCGQQVR